MSKCYDCAKEITHDEIVRYVYSEDGNLMPLHFHQLCYERATKGGVILDQEPREQSNE